MSFNPFADNVSRVSKDPETISISLPMDLDSHGGDSYGDIPPGFQSPLSPAPYSTHVETNLATLPGVAGEEVANMIGEDVNPTPSDIPTMPVDVNLAPSPVAVGSRRGRKKKSEKEREEFWSRRPDWLPEGWEMDVRLRKDGATAGVRDRYYHEPRSGRRFRSRKEVEKFIQTGEVPRYKPKPKIEESNGENISSQNSEPTPSSNIAWPLTLEAYGKHLPSFLGGGKSNQQSEVGGTKIKQDETESTIGIQQPVPSNVDGLETKFNVERENAIGRTHQSKINTEEKGVPKSKLRKKSDLKKEARGRRVIKQSESENVVIGTQQSNQSASLNFSGHEASSSRTKRGAPKIDRDIFERIGREICKMAIFANSKTGTAGSSRKQ